jgi:hypothetical protein
VRLVKGRTYGVMLAAGVEVELASRTFYKSP